jgi:hypothetical protein
MIFFTRFGYLVAVFFVIAAFIAGGAGTAFHLSQESASVLLFLFWGPPCIYYGRTLDHPGKLSYFFGLRLEYWGYGLFAFGTAGRLSQLEQPRARLACGCLEA